MFFFKCVYDIYTRTYLNIYFFIYIHVYLLIYLSLTNFNLLLFPLLRSISLSDSEVISFGILCDGPWHSSLEALRVKGLIGTAATATWKSKELYEVFRPTKGT